MWILINPLKGAAVKLNASSFPSCLFFRPPVFPFSRVMDRAVDKQIVLIRHCVESSLASDPTSSFSNPVSKWPVLSMGDGGKSLTP